jgi:hypothetical protein
VEEDFTQILMVLFKVALLVHSEIRQGAWYVNRVPMEKYHLLVDSHIVNLVLQDHSLIL